VIQRYLEWEFVNHSLTGETALSEWECYKSSILAVRDEIRRYWKSSMQAVPSTRYDDVGRDSIRLT
jgi:hypothetical protein